MQQFSQSCRGRLSALLAMVPALVLCLFACGEEPRLCASPHEFSVPPAGAYREIRVANCGLAYLMGFTVETEPANDWLTVTPVDGATPAVVSVTIAANTSRVHRSGYVIIRADGAQDSPDSVRITQPALAWTTRQAMPTARCELAAAAVNGKIYAVGGYGNAGETRMVEEYDPLTNTWCSKRSMPVQNAALAAVEVDGRIFTIGGFTPSTEHPGIVQAYDPASDTWTLEQPMPTDRSWLAAAVLDGKIYAIGGFDRDQDMPVSTVEEYDPETRTWRTQAPMAYARYGAAAAVVNGRIYAIGGHGVGASPLGTVEEYDPVTNTWRERRSMPTPRCYLGASVVQGKIYAIGGMQFQNYNKDVGTVEEYDPVTDIWTTRQSMPTARFWLTTSVVDGKIYAIGGIQDIYLLTITEEFDPSIEESSRAKSN